MKISTFSVSSKNLSLKTTFSKTHSQTQRMHSWIALDLNSRNKLVPSELNTQILSYDHLLRAVNRQPWLPRGMTRRALPILVCTIQAVTTHSFASTSFNFRANLIATSYTCHEICNFFIIIFQC